MGKSFRSDARRIAKSITNCPLQLTPTKDVTHSTGEPSFLCNSMSTTALPEALEGGVKQESDRFYCPYPGCKRSFAELWRLKVHYRAPPDIRGSGKERGHGTELTHCPKCGKALKPGKHHVGCSAGKTAPRQASKRSRVVSREHDVECWGGSAKREADLQGISRNCGCYIVAIGDIKGMPLLLLLRSPSMATWTYSWKARA